MPQQAYSAPWVQRVKEWANATPSDQDGPLESSLRMIARVIGADDPSGQVLGMMGGMEVGGATGGVGGALERLLDKAKTKIRAYHGSPHVAAGYSQHEAEAAQAQLPPMRPVASHATEPEFQAWYAAQAEQHGLNPNPDAPEQFYDYRAAHAAGAEPDASGHWPSQFKQTGHPNMVVGGFNVKTGERVPGAKLASSVEELIRLGWEPETARRLMRSVQP